MIVIPDLVAEIGVYFYVGIDLLPYNGCMFISDLAFDSSQSIALL